MTIGALFLIAVGAILKFPAATVDVAGIELGTIGVILVILALIGGLVLGLWVLWVMLFFFGRVPEARPALTATPDLGSSYAGDVSPRRA